MRRFVVLIACLVLIGIVAARLWTHHPVEPSPPATGSQHSSNQAPRALTDTEQARFIGLVCGRASGPGNGYKDKCESLIGYPSSDYGGAGLGLDMTLGTVIYGHLTSATANEAYVTYSADFEPHANNFGGGILFAKAAGGWTLKAWYPGGQAGSCVLLTPTGRAHFACVKEWEGQGEIDEQLVVTTMPPPQGEARTLLSATNLVGTMTPNANCQFLKPGQGILLSIQSIAPAPNGAKVKIGYLDAKTAQHVCAENQLATAPFTTGTLDLNWKNDQASLTPVMNFAAAP